MNQSTYNHAQHTHTADGRCKSDSERRATLAEAMVAFTAAYQRYCHDGAKPRHTGTSVYLMSELITGNRELMQGEAS